MLRSRIGIGFILAAVFTVSSGSAEQSIVTGSLVCNREGSCYINDFGITGTITSKTREDVSKLIDQLQAKNGVATGQSISLNSQGGSVYAAMDIGRLLRKYRMQATVASPNVCASACVLIYAGAVTRLGQNLGIHQPYLDVSGRADTDAVKLTYSSMLRDMHAYLKEMNVSEQLADEMLKIPPAHVHFLTRRQQERFGLDIFDPVERELMSVEQARHLGISRGELNHREAYAHQPVG